MPTAFNTYTSFLGIAKETTFGTKVAPTAYIPVTSFKPDDKVAWLEDKGYRGSMVSTYDYIQGPITSTYEYGANVHLDTVGFPLASLLNDVATTGTTTYTTKFAAYNGTAGDPSYTLTDVSDAEVRAYPGCMCTGVDFKFAGNQLLTYDAKWTGAASAVTTKPTATWTTSTYAALPGWNGAVKIGGVSMSTIVSGEFNIACPVEEVITVGAQTPYANWSGLVAATGKLTVVTTDASYRTAMLAGTNTSVEVNYTQGTNSITLHSSTVKYKTVGLDRGKNYLEWSIDFEGIANTTDIGASGGYSPVLVTLVNTMPSGTYK